MNAGAGGKLVRSCKSISNFGEFRYVGDKFLKDCTAIGHGGAFDKSTDCAVRVTPEGDDDCPLPPTDESPMIVDGLTNFGSEFEAILVDPMRIFSTSDDSLPYC